MWARTHEWRCSWGAEASDPLELERQMAVSLLTRVLGTGLRFWMSSKDWNHCYTFPAPVPAFARSLSALGLSKQWPFPLWVHSLFPRTKALGNAEVPCASPRQLLASTAVHLSHCPAWLLTYGPVKAQASSSELRLMNLPITGSLIHPTYDNVRSSVCSEQQERIRKETAPGGSLYFSFPVDFIPEANVEQKSTTG